MQPLSKRYGYIHFAQVPARGLTNSSVVLIIGNSRVESLSAQGTFNPRLLDSLLGVNPTRPMP